jgi:hypothetical protein
VSLLRRSQKLLELLRKPILAANFDRTFDSNYL